MSSAVENKIEKMYTEAVQMMEKALINEAVRAVTQSAEDTEADAET